MSVSSLAYKGGNVNWWGGGRESPYTDLPVTQLKYSRIRTPINTRPHTPRSHIHKHTYLLTGDTLHMLLLWIQSPEESSRVWTQTSIFSVPVPYYTPLKHTHIHTHSRTHAHLHACMHAEIHKRVYTYKKVLSHIQCSANLMHWHPDTGCPSINVLPHSIVLRLSCDW